MSGLVAPFLLLAACATGSEPPEPPASGVVAAAPTGTRGDVEIAAFAAQHAAGARVIDVRTPEEYADGHVPGAVLVPLDALDPNAAPLADYPRDEPVYVVCRTGRRSATAADALAAAGFTAINVTGGTQAWVAEGHAVER